MKGERRLLRVGEFLIASACRHLPPEARDERYREWVAELPAILQDPDVRPPARRAVRMLRYASGTIRGTALPHGRARRVVARIAGRASVWIVVGLVEYFRGWLKTPPDWISIGIGCLIGVTIASGGKLAYRRIRGKSLADDLVAWSDRVTASPRTPSPRALARARVRAARILQARASAGPVTSTAGYAAAGFPRVKLIPGYHVAEVDDFIARIEATLSGKARPGGAVTAADVKAVKFNTSRGGYEELTMDELLEHYANKLDPPAR